MWRKMFFMASFKIYYKPRAGNYDNDPVWNADACGETWEDAVAKFKGTRDESYIHSVYNSDNECVFDNGNNYHVSGPG